MRAHLSEQRAAVLNLLRGHADGARVTQISDEMALHSNTIREHLDAMTDSGLVQRRRAAPAGRGRPAWLYRVNEAGIDSALTDPRLRDYSALAMSLAAAVTRISTNLEEDSVAAGLDWGRRLAEEDTTAGSPEERLRAVQAKLGFAPEKSAEGLTLTQCPLLDAAQRYPEVVCRLHLGIVRGAMDVFDSADTEGSTNPNGCTDSALTPFAAPGSCQLKLGIADKR